MVWVGYMLYSLLSSRAYIVYVLCFLCLRRENQSYPQENVIGFEMRSREGMGRIEFFSKRRQSKEKRYSSHLSNSQLFSIVETNVGSVLSSHVWLLRQFSNFFSRMNWDDLVNFLLYMSYVQMSSIQESLCDFVSSLLWLATRGRKPTVVTFGE